jgi:uncharacterized membrane protein (DUF373 family)
MLQRERRRMRDLGTLAEPALGVADRWLYLLIAVLLLVAAVMILGYSVVNFAEDAGGDFLLAVIYLINDLLLALIVLEVLGTVRDYLATGTTSLRVFLYVGIISAIRRILAIGAETTVGEGVDTAGFQNLMIDLGVNGLVVLALAAAPYLVGHQFPALLRNGASSPDAANTDRVQPGTRADEPP